MMILKQRLQGIVLFIIALSLVCIGVKYYRNLGTPGEKVQTKVLPDPIRYTVKNGDSLYAIAGQYGVSVGQIQKKNQLTGNIIVPGQVLTISAGVANSGQYSVKSGDTLYWIARQSGITVAALKQANGLTSDAIDVGQMLSIPGGKTSQSGNNPDNNGNLNASGNLPLSQILTERGIALSNPNLRIVVDKSDKILCIYSGNTWLKTYPVELGDKGLGDKQVNGDHKTPEGTFYIAEKSVLNPSDEYLGSRWMRLSYPNIEDADRGLAQNLIDPATHDQIVAEINQGLVPLQQTMLGGGVGIHGGSTPDKGSNWTWGCIGLSNHDVEDFYNFIQVGTPVIVQY